MFRRPKITPIIEQVQAYQPPAQGDVHQEQNIDGEYIMAAIILNQYYIRFMEAAKRIRSALPLRMQDVETGKYPALDELYCTLGLMRIDIARLNGDQVERER